LLNLYRVQGRFEEALSLLKRGQEQWGEDKQWNQRINRYLVTMLIAQGNVEKARELALSSQVALDGSDYAKMHLWDKAEEKIEGTRVVGEDQEETFGYYRTGHRRALLESQGNLAFARGNAARAAEYFEQAKASYSGLHHGSIAYTVDGLARAYYVLGNYEKAAEEFELITTLTWDRLSYGDIYARSFYMLGKICEKAGKKRDARRNYKRFLELWKNADPGLPEVDDAKARLAAL
jgi:tetratricopeptide (TPR) repeat protein